MIRRAEPEDWEVVRDIRLRMLREEPDAYASEYQTEAQFEPGLWKQRLATAASYLAFDDDQVPQRPLDRSRRGRLRARAPQRPLGSAPKDCFRSQAPRRAEV